MIASIKNCLVKTAIKEALRRKAPDVIPLSGMERLRGRDYFVIELMHPSAGDSFLVRSERNNKLCGLWFTSSSADTGLNASVAYHTASSCQLKITHYANELTLQYSSAIGFIWARYTFHAKRQIWKFRFSLWAFSKTKLPRDDRMEVLAWLYNSTLENAERKPAFNPVTFLYHKHGKFILFHPEQDRLINYYRIIFESLEASEDLRRHMPNRDYSLSSNALVTLDKYEVSERRHKDNIRQQRILGWLTFALFIASVGQIIITFF